MGVSASCPSISVQVKEHINPKKIKKGECVICFNENTDVIDFCGNNHNHDICISCFNNNIIQINKCPYCRQHIDKNLFLCKSRKNKIKLVYPITCYNNRVEAYNQFILLGFANSLDYNMVKTYLINTGCSSLDECDFCKKNNSLFNKYTNDQNFLEISYESFT